MSHLINQPPAWRWACWYSPEFIGGALLASTAGVLFGGQAMLVGLAAPVVVGVQEAERLINNARVRRERTNRAAEDVAVAVENGERGAIESIDEPQAWVDEDGSAVVIGTHDVELAARLMLAETGTEPDPLTPCWVVIVDEPGEPLGWRFVEAGAPHAIPACGW